MIYVLSDVHGNQEAFDSILAQIMMTEDDYLYIIGDVVDRGPYGIDLLQRIRRMPNTILILGNHEYMMLNRLRNPNDRELKNLWYKNGGRETEKKFLSLKPEEQESLLLYLESLPVQIDVSVQGKTYLLVHACPIEMFIGLTGWYENETEFAVWQRLGPDAKLFGEKTLIFGHTPTIYYVTVKDKMRIFHGNGRIGIDCGCAYPDLGGQLACLRLDDMKEFYALEGD